MRLADADLIPFEYTGLADTVAKYVKDLEKLLKDKQDEFTERNIELEEGVFTATADPRKTFVPPPVESVPPYLNFAPLKNGVESLKRNADRYTAAAAKVESEGLARLSQQQLDRLNTALIEVQRLFLTEKGLPERPWFKHQLYAPGAYTGYGAKPIAAVREYMDQKKWKEAETQVPTVAKVLEDVATAVGKVAEELEALVPRKQ